MLSVFVLVFSLLNFALLLFVLWSQYVARTEQSAGFTPSLNDWERTELTNAIESDATPVPCGVHHPTPEAMKAAEKTRAVLRTSANWNPYA